MLKTTNNISEVVNDIAISLIPVPPTIHDPFWLQSAQDLFKSFLFYFITLKKSFIGTIYIILTTNIIDLIQEVSESSVTQAQSLAMSFVGMETKTLMSIYRELTTKINTFIEDYELQIALSNKNTITPADLENGYDVYIVIQESNLDRWSNLLTLIINQFLKSFERRAETRKNPVLFVLDEFPRLGKINSVINGLGTLRSKGVTMCLVIQSLAQIEAIYGLTVRKIIADNCTYKAVLMCSDPESQKYFSSLIGTKKVERKTYTKGKGEGFMRKTSEAMTYVDEPIVRPETLAYIQEILLITPRGYIWIEKTPYYSHPVLNNL
jgi:type IV secretion system protein VirD4